MGKFTILSTNQKNIKLVKLTEFLCNVFHFHFRFRFFVFSFLRFYENDVIQVNHLIIILSHENINDICMAITTDYKYKQMSTIYIIYNLNFIIFIIKSRPVFIILMKQACFACFQTELKTSTQKTE